MFRLHYLKIGSTNKSIPCFEFKKHKQMIDFIDSSCVNRNHTVVWVLSNEEIDDIFISENYLSILEFLSKKDLWQIHSDFSLHEYQSFEEAYKFALFLAEKSELCYSI